MRVYASDAVGAGDARIGGAGGVGNGIEFAIRVDQAEVAAVLADFAAHANDSEIRLPSPQRIVGCDAFAGGLVVGEQRAYRPGAFLSREAHAIERVGDATGKHQVDGSGEVA